MVAHKKILQLVTDKNCVVCGITKPASDFFASKANKQDGLDSKCKDCTRQRKKEYFSIAMSDPDKKEKYLAGRKRYRRTLKSKNTEYFAKYGITFSEVERMLTAQYGLCANRGCGKNITLDSDKALHSSRACVDHDHDTGKVRALLCRPCNAILGTLEAQTNVVLGLLDYACKFNPTKDSRLFKATNNLLNKE
jgi:hypothetical protein